MPCAIAIGFTSTRQFNNPVVAGNLIANRRWRL